MDQVQEELQFFAECTLDEIFAPVLELSQICVGHLAYKRKAELIKIPAAGAAANRTE